ncbi:hypothetical protein I7I53_04447 [Histoplasma capsulatum var. duboisii H88]|uniref:Uncharacterized protein n=1 Tax=Ajellomyces capsulatus (strain H88) TaxID=544711 RepID=A0A8A1LWF6_AJEC8|nr:hypothetical protein I7I53_04447 [Histoplasma capsulatum var. duboisii H88]
MLIMERDFFLFYFIYLLFSRKPMKDSHNEQNYYCMLTSVITSLTFSHRTYSSHLLRLLHDAKTTNHQRK